MKILIENPPNIEQIRKAFDLSGVSPVFTYGDTIYNPGNNPIPDDLMAHESTHRTQQYADGPEAWWTEYLKNPQFRLSQELEAYQRQYRVAKTTIKDRNQLFNFLYRIASDLSSPMYGNMISHSEAMRQIKL